MAGALLSLVFGVARGEHERLSLGATSKPHRCLAFAYLVVADSLIGVGDPPDGRTTLHGRPRWASCSVVGGT